jgi:hypothetical protein
MMMVEGGEGGNLNHKAPVQNIQVGGGMDWVFGQRHVQSH